MTLSKSNVRRWLAWLLVLLVAILIPLVTGDYVVSVLTLICIWAIACVSVNVIYGYTGLVAVAHSAFMGIGAYAYGLSAIHLGIGFWPALIIAVIVTGIVGFLIGIPAVRLRGPYFILITLAFGIVIATIVVAWYKFTGGGAGLGGAPRPTIPLPGGEFAFDSPVRMYYFCLFFLLLSMVILARLVNSLVGRTFIAIREDEALAQSLGINTFLNKLLSFTISTMIVAVAGVLFASFNKVISPDLAHFMKGMEMLAFLIVGGAGTMAGVLIGPLVMVAIPEVLQVMPQIRTLIFGFILLLFIIFLPQGIAGGFKMLALRWRWPWEGTKMEKHGTP